MKCPTCQGSGSLGGNTSPVGARSIAARDRLGISQYELARRVGMSRAHVALVENGYRDIPARALRLYADALGVAVDELIP